MKLHRFEKTWTVVALVLIVAFIGTVTYGAVGAGVTMVGDDGDTIDDSSNPADDPSFRDPGVYQVGEDRYEVYVIARQFLYQPGSAEPIRVPAGSTVTFYVTSADVIHGFEVVGTNVNTMAIPGQVAKMTVRFEEPDEYGIVCNEYCGSAHHSMEGRLQVVPRDEFEGGQ